MPKMSPQSISFAALFLAFPAAYVAAQAQAGSAAGPGQTAAPTATPRQSGTVKAVTPHDFVLTTAAGQDYAVTVPEKARILLVPPGSRDLSQAQPGTMGDIAAGDRAIVSGTTGDSGAMLSAARVIVMKSSAIAASHEADQAAWSRGVGGIVRSVDPAKGVITASSGLRTLTVDTTPNTIVRRYAGASVRFEDAVKSSVGAIAPGDQIRVRGERTPASSASPETSGSANAGTPGGADAGTQGTTIIADEIVAGSFANFSGLLTAVDPGAGTVTLKDLATKRTVTVAVSDGSNLRRMPPGMGQTMASRGQEGQAGQGGQASAAPASSSADGANGARRSGAGAGGGGRGSAGGDLSRMIGRMPTETLAGLKPGDAVMIVASNNPQSGQPTAITLLAGVEQVLAAHPSGETTLSPWNLGGGGAEGGGVQ